MRRLAVLRHPDAVSHEAGAYTLADYSWSAGKAPSEALWTLTVAVARAFGGTDFPSRTSGVPADALMTQVHQALQTCGLTDDDLAAMMKAHAADPYAVAHAYYQAALAQCKDSLTGPDPKKPLPWGWILAGTALAGAGVATVVVLSRRGRRRRR